MGAEPVVELRDVVKVFHGHLGFGRFVAVDGLGFEVRRGEVFGLLGPNGAGKTTTLKLLLGLLRPDSGSIRVLGALPGEPASLARIGFLPEQPYFYDYLTGEEFLDFYGRLHGISAGARSRRVAETLERVGLRDRARVALRKFSKGMVQRLGLAQAILHDPELVILDEPMSGLDPVGRREVRDLILDLRARGRSVLFSSHILQDAEVLCDRVAIAVRGRLRHLGTLDDMLSRAPRWFEVQVAGPVPAEWTGERRSAQGELTLIRVPDVEALGRLLAAVPGDGGRVVSVWPRRESLEDLFLREVGVSTEAAGDRR